MRVSAPSNSSSDRVLRQSEAENLGRGRMTNHLILAQLSELQAMMRELVRREPRGRATAPVHAELACLAWYLGRSVFRETYWLREVVAGDADLTDRVRQLFPRGAIASEAQCAQLTPWPSAALGTRDPG